MCLEPGDERPLHGVDVALDQRRSVQLIDPDQAVKPRVVAVGGRFELLLGKSPTEVFERDAELGGHDLERLAIEGAVVILMLLIVGQLEGPADHGFRLRRSQPVELVSHAIVGRGSFVVRLFIADRAPSVFASLIHDHITLVPAHLAMIPFILAIVAMIVVASGKRARLLGGPSRPRHPLFGRTAVETGLNAPPWGELRRRR